MITPKSRPANIDNGRQDANHGSLGPGPLSFAAWAWMVVLAVSCLVALAAAVKREESDTSLVVAASLAVAATFVVAAILMQYQRQHVKGAGVLRSMEARAAGLVDSAMDAIIALDAEFHVVVFNAAAEKVFQCAAVDMLGKPLDALLPERFRHTHSAHIAQFSTTGVTRRKMGDQTILMGLRANGEEFPIEVSISQHMENGSKQYMAILRDISERVAAEQALRKSKDDLYELASAAHTVREQEKRRIARELHDELGQALTALKMDVAWLRERTRESGEVVTDKLSKMQTLLDTTVASTRRISSELRPMMLDDLGLFPAVEWLVQGFTQRTGIPCELQGEAEELEIPNDHATAIFRILQESLTNITKHAEATRVFVSLQRIDDELVVTVEDDGKGFDTSTARKPHSFGLLGLRERAFLLGGITTIHSEPGRGTSIEARVPIAPTENT